MPKRYNTSHNQILNTEMCLHGKFCVPELCFFLLLSYDFKYCNVFVGSLFKMEVYYTESSIHNYWLHSENLLEF
jgi:hypothetical protein